MADLWRVTYMGEGVRSTTVGAFAKYTTAFVEEAFARTLEGDDWVVADASGKETSAPKGEKKPEKKPEEKKSEKAEDKKAEDKKADEKKSEKAEDKKSDEKKSEKAEKPAEKAPEKK